MREISIQAVVVVDYPGAALALPRMAVARCHFGRAKFNTSRSRYFVHPQKHVAAKNLGKRQKNSTGQGVVATF
ncbi:MAG: hypothetical protein KIT73_11745 [Burkholderiales bacterium]|nr:hypothetical protein [Burkholderiales bacterium]